MTCCGSAFRRAYGSMPDAYNESLEIKALTCEVGECLFPVM